MIMQGDKRRTLSTLSRAAIFGLAALALPIVPAFGQDRLPEDHSHESAAGHGRHIDKQTQGALRHAIELLRNKGGHRDAALLSKLLGGRKSNPFMTKREPKPRVTNPIATIARINNFEKQLAELHEHANQLAAKGEYARQRQVDQLIIAKEQELARIHPDKYRVNR